MYGYLDKGFKRLALHAETLAINHPFTKEKITFKAPFPAYFKSLMKA